MRPYVRRIAAASAAAYLLAGWLAAALHSHVHLGHAGHAHGGQGHAAEADGVCTTCTCGHDHGPKRADREPEAPENPEEGHHHCVVCDFLAKPPVKAATVQVVEAIEPVVAAAEPAVPVVEAVDVLVLRSRGPPVA